jgi:hypothetical protein
MQVKAREAVDAKIVFARAVKGPVNFAVQAQKQGYGVFGDRVGRIARHANDADLPIGGIKIHIVVARAAKGDESYAQRVKRLDGFAAYVIVYKGNDRLAAFRKLGGVTVQLRFKVAYIKNAVVQFPKRLPVIGLCVEKAYLYHRNTSGFCCQ